MGATGSEKGYRGNAVARAGLERVTLAGNEQFRKTQRC